MNTSSNNLIYAISISVREFLIRNVFEQIDILGLLLLWTDIAENITPDEKKHIEAFDNLVHLFETTHMDNFRVLKALTGKDEVYECRTKKMV